MKTIAGRLHHRDGRRGPEGARLEHFRLVTESTPGRVGFDLMYANKNAETPPEERVSYKLFEIVKGAVLEVQGSEGERVSASVSLETEDGRTFSYAAAKVIDASGRVQLRVPYATGGAHPVRAKGPYRVSQGFSLARVNVDERDVLEGRTVLVTFDEGGALGF